MVILHSDLCVKPRGHGHTTLRPQNPPNQTDFSLRFHALACELFAPIMTGQAPVNLSHYTTMFTHGCASAVITPACEITGIYLLKRKPLGYLSAALLLILCTIIGATVIAQTTSQMLAGFVFPIGVYIGMIGS